LFVRNIELCTLNDVRKLSKQSVSGEARMKFIVGVALFLLFIGFTNKGGETLIGLGALILLSILGWKLTKWGARKTSSAVSTALSDRRSEKEFQTNLRREVQRERELSAVRNEGMIELLRAQVELIAKHKREGADVEREIIEMRKKLLDYEATENKAMIGELISTLDRL
jgi:flagellar biosynthesis component FlhA